MTESHPPPEGPKRHNADPAWAIEAIRRIQAGDDPERHFQRLYAHYEPAVRRLVRSFLRREDVEDLVQEAMIRVCKGVKSFRFDSTLHTWMASIVRNLVRNAHRDSQTYKAQAALATTSLDALLAEDREAAHAAQEPTDTSADPLDRLLDSERLEHLEAELEQLPARMRRCFELYHFHGYKYREIADLLDINIGTVKKQILDGRRRLRPTLALFAKLFGLFLVLLVMTSGLV